MLRRSKPLFRHAVPLSARVERAFRRIDLKNAEEANKAKVRRRDRGCRFPLCGCRRLGLSASVEVSHSVHKGSGGDPTGERSDSRLMMNLCRERHRVNPFAIDKGTVGWRPVEKSLGADGPVVWLLDVALLRYYREGGRRPARARLVEVARESTAGHLAPLTDDARVWLEHLATMEL